MLLIWLEIILVYILLIVLVDVTVIRLNISEVNSSILIKTVILECSGIEFYIVIIRSIHVLREDISRENSIVDTDSSVLLSRENI